MTSNKIRRPALAILGLAAGLGTAFAATPDPFGSLRIMHYPKDSDLIVEETPGTTVDNGLRVGLIKPGQAYLEFVKNDVADICDEQNGVMAEIKDGRLLSWAPLPSQMMTFLQVALQGDRKTGRVSEDTIVAARALAGQTDDCRYTPEGVSLNVFKGTVLYPAPALRKLTG